VTPVAAGLDEALAALEFLLGLTGRFVPMELSNETDAFAVRRPWHDIQGDWRLPARVRFADERFSDDVRLSLGRPTRSWGMAGGAHFLWAVTESKRELGALRRFHARPSVVLRAKQARWALWLLPKPASYANVLRANRRLSYALGTKRRTADPDLLWLPAPGTCVRRGVKQARPVTVEVLEVHDWSMRALVGSLRDAPDADAWRERAAR
jgi:hypothetical protein